MTSSLQKPLSIYTVELFAGDSCLQYEVFAGDSHEVLPTVRTKVTPWLEVPDWRDM